MNTPFLLLGAAILFWGMQTEHWLVAAVCALLFEAARYVPRRWEFAPEKLNSISDFGVVLAGLLGAYLYLTLGNPRAITQLFVWLPVALLPLALSQAYGTHRDIEAGVLFWSMRRMRRRRPMRINIGYAYFATWIIAASAANPRGISFELGMIALAAWALWQARPRSYPVALWLLLVPLAGGLSYAAHNGLHGAQLWLEGNAPEWLRSDGGTRTNPYRADTDIGRIGELKQSDRIVLRVYAAEKFARPLLLHRASYDTYTGLRWLAKNAAFIPVAQSGSAGTWPLVDPPAGTAAAMQSVSIVEQSVHVKPVLSLPAYTQRIKGLAASEMQRNALGAVQIEHSPGFVRYRAFYIHPDTPGLSAVAAPGPTDLAVPRHEADALQQVVAALKLKDMPPSAALATLERYFADNFSYSLYQRDMQSKGSPLTGFLLETRAGHCEYFASAAVLLLRAAGIPARYATGFSVQEWSALESAYVVRERHAHAWAQVWIAGAWREIDTTPATWIAVEAGAAPWWSRAADFWSWLQLRFSELQSREGEMPLTWIAVAAVLALWIGWRLFGKPARTARAPATSLQTQAVFPGMDSAFYRIEAHLGERGWARASGETMGEWFARITPHLAHLPARDELAALLHLHYRSRFDPSGLAVHEQESFSARVNEWLQRAKSQTHPLAPFTGREPG